MGGRRMTRAEAAAYAAQWGATDSPGACAAYNLGAAGFSSRDAAELRAYALGDCLAIAERGACCGIAGACASDIAELKRLADHCAEIIALGVPPT